MKHKIGSQQQENEYVKAKKIDLENIVNNLVAEINQLSGEDERVMSMLDRKNHIERIRRENNLALSRTASPKNKGLNSTNRSQTHSQFLH